MDFLSWPRSSGTSFGAGDRTHTKQPHRPATAWGEIQSSRETAGLRSPPIKALILHKGFPVSLQEPRLYFASFSVSHPPILHVCNRKGI